MDPQKNPGMEGRGPRPSEAWENAVLPTRGTLFLRTFLPWQAWRFVWINLKMIRIIFRSHGSH